MTLILKIDQNETYNFFQEYTKLGPLEQKIWKSAVWWATKHPTAFPKQGRIAEYVGCRREHVNRAFAKFQKFGWLSLVSRGSWKTKILVIPNHLLAIDFSKKDYYKKIHITRERTHRYSKLKSITSNEDTGDSSNEISIADHLKSLKISLESKLKLSFFNESVYQQALECAKYAHSKKTLRDDKVEKYVVETAIRIGAKQNMKIDWKKYYKFLEKAA